MNEARQGREVWRPVVGQVVGGVLIAVLVGIGSAAVTGAGMMTRLEERIMSLERDVARHESAIEKDMKRIEDVNAVAIQRTEDHERRLARLESTLGNLRDDVAEMKQDIKLLLRSASHSAAERR